MQDIDEAWAELRHIALVRNIKLAVTFFVLNIVDTTLTQFATSNGGYELNPIMATFLKQPSWVFWWFKISLALTISLTLLILANKAPHAVKRIFIALVIAMAGVCIFNGVGLWL